MCWQICYCFRQIFLEATFSAWLLRLNNNNNYKCNNSNNNKCQQRKFKFTNSVCLSICSMIAWICLCVCLYRNIPVFKARVFIVTFFSGNEGLHTHTAVCVCYFLVGSIYKGFVYNSKCELIPYIFFFLLPNEIPLVINIVYTCYREGTI